MSYRNFSLKPFPAASVPEHVRITGNISRSGTTLSLNYRLHGPIEDIAVARSTEPPCRKTALWEETCFEFFLGTHHSPRYWEFNLSPAGHWNVYRFASYRQGMREEPAFQSLPFRVSFLPDGLQISLHIAMERLIPPETDWQVAVAAVLKAPDGGTSFWALTHPGPRADFHRREGFLVSL